MSVDALSGRAKAGIHYRGLILALAAVTAVLFMVSLAVGYAGFDLVIALQDVVAGRTTLASLIVLELRLPRALLGVLVGFSLGISGAAMQGMLRNPLADPGITGVTSAASLGAVIVFYAGLTAAVPLALPLGGIAGALVATVLLFGIAGPAASTMTLIMAGVAISSFFAALTTLALNLSPSPFAVTEIVFWMLGSLADRDMSYVWLATPLMALGWVLLLRSGRFLDGLALGEDTAASLGFDVSRMRLQLIAGTALAVGSAVATTGAIAFVGLVVPHLLRPRVGHLPSRLLLASGFGGAILTLAADISVRALPIQPELKLGVVTALIGAPFLFHLIYTLRSDPR